MERIVHKAKNHQEAHQWDVEQHVKMSPEERLAVARVLKNRAFPADARDVRECHRPE